MNVLVVEDDRPVAELLQRALEEMGNSCYIAEDPAQADSMLDEHVVDAVTLDLGIPGGGGLAWLETMAERRPDLARKTLVITGLVLEPDCVTRLARCGAGILAKPFTLDSLGEAVRSQLARVSASGPDQN